MDHTDLETSRRRLLKGAAATGLLYGGVGLAASDDQEPFDEAFGTVSGTTGDATTSVVYPPTIETIRSPLAMNPAIHEGSETLRVELDADAGVVDPTVTIRPTFGSVRPETELSATVVADAVTSELWLDTQPDVTVVEADLPPVSATPSASSAPLSPGLYDVTVAWDGGESTETQPRSLSLRESFPDEPRVYVISDAHAGDPRALASGLEESAEEGDPEPFLYRYENVLGVGTDTDRWGGFRRAVAEVSALDPDVVVFPGDLAFGQDAPKKYYQEYADAYAMLSSLRAPVYTALGNHDGYIQGSTDGKQLYHKYIGPWYWSRELRADFRLTCIDSYDWAATDRQSASYATSAWGGQARDTQLERLRAVLEEWYDPDAGQTHLSVSHHQPAWREDPGNEVHDETEGTPLAEQVGRGAGDFAFHGTAGQGWRGEGRTEVLELLTRFDTDLHLAGHAHRDRLSRVTADGDVVYTPTGDAELAAYDHGTNEDRSEAYDLEAELLSGDGTLFVDATTAGSETTQYWGWRAFDLARGGDTIDPSEFGYQPSDPGAFLEERAVDDGLWPPEHAALGRYAHPTFEFDVEAVESDERGAAVRVVNDLESDRTGTLLLSVEFEGRPSVEGGELLWRRTGDGVQDVAVAYDVDAESEREVRVEPGGRSGRRHGR